MGERWDWGKGLERNAVAEILKYVVGTRYFGKQFFKTLPFHFRNKITGMLLCDLSDKIGAVELLALPGTCSPELTHLLGFGGTSNALTQKTQVQVLALSFSIVIVIYLYPWIKCYLTPGLLGR